MAVHVNKRAGKRGSFAKPGSDIPSPLFPPDSFFVSFPTPRITDGPRQPRGRGWLRKEGGRGVRCVKWKIPPLPPFSMPVKKLDGKKRDSFPRFLFSLSFMPNFLFFLIPPLLFFEGKKSRTGGHPNGRVEVEKREIGIRNSVTLFLVRRSGPEIAGFLQRPF